MLVVAGHALAVAFVPSGMQERLGRSSPIWLFMGSPWAGVWIFFVLSGYLMGKGFFSGRYDVSKEGVKRFYRSRIARVVPVYYSALIIVAILVVPQIFSIENLWQIIALGLFSLQMEAPTPVIGALWSIQTEMAFYVMVPLLFYFLNKTARIVPPLLLMAVLASLGFLYRWIILRETQNLGWINRAYAPLIANIDLFLIGMLINWLVPATSKALKKVPALHIGLAILVLNYIIGSYVFVQAGYGIDHVIYFWYAVNIGPTFTTGVALICILLFESHAASNKTESYVIGRFIAWTQLAGTLSYALYVWHEPIFLRMRSVQNNELSTRESVTAAILATTLSVAIAYGVFRFIEAPLKTRGLWPATIQKAKT